MLVQDEGSEILKRQSENTPLTLTTHSRQTWKALKRTLVQDDVSKILKRQSSEHTRLTLGTHSRHTRKALKRTLVTPGEDT